MITPPPLSATSALCTAHKLLELSFKSFHWGLCHFTLSFVYWVEGGGTTKKKQQHSNSSCSRTAITVHMSSAADLSRPTFWTMATAVSAGPLVPPSQPPPPLHRLPASASPRRCLQWALMAALTVTEAETFSTFNPIMCMNNGRALGDWQWVREKSHFPPRKI